MTEQTINKRPKKQKPTPSIVFPTNPMTLDQFRSYLRGIMFVGGAEWYPNHEQWGAIMNVIDTLIVTPHAGVEQQYSYQPQRQLAQPPSAAVDNAFAPARYPLNSSLPDVAYTTPEQSTDSYASPFL